MPVDENEFFREATIRICSSLEIEKALSVFLEYGSRYIPMDRILVQISPSTEDQVAELLADVDRDGVRGRYLKNTIPREFSELKYILEAENIISTNPSGIGMKVDLPSGDKLLRLIRKHNLDKMIPEVADGQFKFPLVMMRDNVRTDSFTKTVASMADLPESPCLHILLFLEGAVLGSLLMVNYSNSIYTHEHARLISLINEPLSIAIANSIRYKELKQLQEQLADENRFLHRELRGKQDEEIVGADFGLKPAMELVRQVAPLDSPVLLLGETGVGKEVFAHTIHNFSPRRDGSLVTVNCGAIPGTLIDSELFGHEKGAFTGALSLKKGRFERAHGGTIFLDEVAELPLEAQVRLLRVLQEKVIERVGASESIEIDIRIVAATHRNLEKMVEEGRFREDLYFRLRVFPIVIPPLRERTMDIPSLLSHFLIRKSREMKLGTVPTIAPGALDRLMAYEWPGNVRELENAVERALIINRGEPLTFYDIVPTRSQGAGRTSRTEPDGGIVTLDAAMASHIGKALEITGGKVHGSDGAAELLGINASTLRNRMRKLGIAFGRGAKGNGNRTANSLLKTDKPKQG